MTRREDIAAFALAGVAIFSFAVLLAFALHRLLATEAEMRRDKGDNMLWAISQTHSSALLFDLAIARRAGIPGSKPDLERRYHVLLSRLSMLSEGPQARHMEDLGLSGVLDEALRAVLALESHVRDLSFGETGTADSIHEVIGPLIDALGRAANQSMVNAWEATGSRLDRRREAIAQTIIAVLAILVLGTLLSVMMVRAMAERQRIRNFLSRERETAEIYRDFVALVSHQFRTPLAIIDSSMQRLLRSRGRMPYPEIEVRARQARSEILRLTRLIAATLDVIRLDAGQVRAEPQPCEVVELIVRARARQLAGTPERVIRIEVADDVPTKIDTDPVLVQEILANLVSNAVKYSPGTEPVVLRASAENRQVWFCVEDCGTGISSEEQPKLFGRFFRGSASQGVPGVGIGLAISRRLASLLGGDLVFASRPGVGSSFTLKLPCEWRGGEPRPRGTTHPGKRAVAGRSEGKRSKGKVGDVAP